MMRVARALKTVNYRLLIAVFATMLLPAVYQTVRINFLGELPSDSGINIASQLSWVNLFYEVVQEALILPLFYLLGKSLTDKEEFVNKVRTGLLVTALVYMLLSVIIIAAAEPLVTWMAQDKELIQDTVDYIRLETVAALFATLWRFMSLVLVTLKKDIHIYVILVVQMTLSVLLDTFLISKLPVSANIGVNGVAATNIIVNLVIMAIACILLRKEDIHIFSKRKLSFGWLKEWFSVGKFSGLESLLRNLAFMIMVVRMVNIVEEQGNYWVANNFIWQWLLLPGLALADVVKKEIGEDRNNVERKTFGYLCFVIIFGLLWLVTIPAWKLFLQYVMNIAEYEVVYQIALIETPFYMTFLFNSCIFDSTFYGLGKTQYMLFQSICIDGVYYGIMFILYLTGVFVPSLYGICLMFGVGMALDFVPAIIFYIKLLKKEGLRVDFALKDV